MGGSASFMPPSLAAVPGALLFSWPRLLLLFGRVNGGRRLAQPLRGSLGREKRGEQLKGLRATPDRQIAQHSA